MGNSYNKKSYDKNDVRRVDERSAEKKVCLY